MKKFLTATLVACCLQAYAQEKVILEKPHVDKRVELLSIVFRLAENEEYSAETFKPYTDRIEQHFAPHKNHELIVYAKSLIKERHIGYDAPMALAVHLDDNLNLLTNVTKEVWQIDKRWIPKDVAKFISLLQQFAKDSKFDDFFNANADLYAEASKRLAPAYELLDLSWHRTFYGKELTEIFSIVIGASAGWCNYGADVNYANEDKKVYAIIGIGRADKEGMPKFDEDYVLSTLIHEFNHSFANDLIDKNEKALKGSGKKLFSVVKKKMARQAYAQWKTVMYEALVRAAVIKYYKDHDAKQSKVESLIKEEKRNGFLWIEELVAELENYDKQRDKYPTLESYMPKIIEAYKVWAKEIPREVKKLEKKRPEVISISEFKNGSKSVSADTKTITVSFSEPLSGKGHSIWIGSKGMDALPKINGVRYANNNQSVVMEVSLEKDKEYQLVFVGDRYTSVDGVGIKDYEINFKTAK